MAVVGLLSMLAAQPPGASAATTPNWGKGIEVQLPVNAGSPQRAALGRVSCPSAGDCTAVGGYTDTSGHQQAMVVNETSGKWARAIEAPLPANAGSGPSPQLSDLTALSCASPGDCTAVGFYVDSSGHDQGLLLTEASGMWATGIEAPLPANAGSGPSVLISSVSCPSTGNCTAVGAYLDSSHRLQGLLLTEASGVWATGVDAPLPPNALVVGGLTAVSCASAGDCSAVGNFVDSSGDSHGLLLTEASGTWATGVEATLPANAGSNPQVNLDSLSCPSVGACSVVGTYVDGSGNLQGLLLTKVSGAWTTGVEATLPANAGSNPLVLFGSVSCPSAGNCTAVGFYTDSSSHVQGLLLTETSGLWARGIEAALPANAAAKPLSLAALLNSVSCPSAGNCTAVGGYTVTSGDLQGLLVSEASNKWSRGVQAALPANAGSGTADLSDVSCVSARDCTAVGDYTDSSGHLQGLIVSTVPAKPPAPTLSAVRLGSKSFSAKTGTTLKLTLSQKAKVTVVVAQTVKGHKVKGVCKPKTRKGKNCTITVARRTLTFSGSAGKNAFKLKLSGLAAGSYTATVAAHNANGKSRPVKLTFVIIHG